MPKFYDLTGKKIFVAGHRGMVGSAITEKLRQLDCELLVADRGTVNLANQQETRQFIGDERPDAVVVAAAKVGGILANSTYPVDFLLQNLQISVNVIEASHLAKVERLLYLGSSCIYPKFAPQPIEESSLLSGPLEPTNEWYAVAKIAGIKLCQAYFKQFNDSFISAMPTNLYGPRDNFDLDSSHVLPALLRKAHDAKMSGAESITIWGTGTPLREFMHAADCADACVFLLQHYFEEHHVNIGSGAEISVLELARLISDVVGYSGDIVCDNDKPDGTPRKLMSSSKLRDLGWSPSYSLADGIKHTYDWYLSNIEAYQQRAGSAP